MCTHVCGLLCVLFMCVAFQMRVHVQGLVAASLVPASSSPSMLLSLVFSLAVVVAQDRERVLRLLFAKINSVSTRTYQPPQSAASDPGTHRTDEPAFGRGTATMAALPPSIAGLVRDEEPGISGPFGLTAGGDDARGYYDDDSDDGGEYGNR